MGGWVYIQRSFTTAKRNVEQQNQKDFVDTKHFV